MRERIFLALVHHPTLDRRGAVVATAVTTLDLHDLARLGRTYGLCGVYATTPLRGQRSLVARLLKHWVGGAGGRLNPCRREALEGLRVVESLAEASREVERLWGEPPVTIGTSAREGQDRLTFREARSLLGASRQPVLLVFGTGWGLAPEAEAACRWVLEPVRGAAGYNHLSVRTAAAIVVDRLLAQE